MTVGSFYSVSTVITWSLFIINSRDFTETWARGPVNITRAEGEMEVFIPCPFEFRPAPSIWKINGTEYFTTTLPSSVYTQTAGGLFIKRVDKCLDHTSFQCIDTSYNSLRGEESSTGYLTVTSPDTCIGMHADFFLNLNEEVQDIIEIDYQRTVFGSINTTLAWVNTATGCNITEILSYPQCQPMDFVTDIVINKTDITIPVENFEISGNLADFSISSSQGMDMECPTLLETIRINVTQTSTLDILAGNNDCTCVNVECQGALHVAISSPSTSPADVPLCPVNGIRARSDTCYRPDNCSDFEGTSFFRICQNITGSMTSNTDCTTPYNMCFDRTTTDLNGTRLDFFVVEREICNPVPPDPYLYRKYVQSFQLNVKNASVTINIDSSTGVICFHSSPQGCNLTQLTRYHVSISDLTKNVIVTENNIPEGSCTTVKNFLTLHCHPFIVSTQPFNDFITYSPIDDLIAGKTGVNGDVCNCINENVQIQIMINGDTVLESSMMKIDYLCNTSYLNQLNVTLVVTTEGRTFDQFEIVCSAGSISLNSSLNQCGQIIHLSGYWTFNNTNEAMYRTCSLFSHLIPIECPTASPSHTGAIIAVILVVAILSILGIIMALVCCKYRFRIRKTARRLLSFLYTTRGDNHNEGNVDNEVEGDPEETSASGSLPSEDEKL